MSIRLIYLKVLCAFWKFVGAVGLGILAIMSPDLARECIEEMEANLEKEKHIQKV